MIMHMAVLTFVLVVAVLGGVVHIVHIAHGPHAGFGEVGGGGGGRFIAHGNWGGFLRGKRCGAGGTTVHLSGNF